MRGARFTVTVLVADEADWDVVARILEAQADLLVSAIEEESGDVVLDKLLYDPQHPDQEPDCACDGPLGWHCPGEDSMHWAERDTKDSPCGHCGGDPADLDADA